VHFASHGAVHVKDFKRVRWWGVHDGVVDEFSDDEFDIGNAISGRWFSCDIGVRGAGLESRCVVLSQPHVATVSAPFLDATTDYYPVLRRANGKRFTLAHPRRRRSGW